MFPRRGHLRFGRRRRRPRRPLGGAARRSRARPPGSRRSGANDADREDDGGADRGARAQRRATTANARLIALDQRIHRPVYRCAHNPFLEATLEEYFVLGAAHLVPRARPCRAARGRARSSTARSSRRSATAMPTRAEAVMRGHVAGLRARDPRRARSSRRPAPTDISRTETRCHERSARAPRGRRDRCGIVGNSLAYHLTRLGWSDVLLLDKGPLPNPGGSTGHASNFIFPVDHSKEMTQLTLESQRQYAELGVFTECGGIEVARTEERLEELRRRLASAKAWGSTRRARHAGRDQGARPLHRRVGAPRRLLLPDRLASSTRSGPAR